MTSHFIILAPPRSGSSWLGSLLDHHSQITVFGELFLPYAVPNEFKQFRANDPVKFFQYCHENKGIRPFITGAYLDHVFQNQSCATGFKLMCPPFVKHPEIIHYCNTRQIKVIYLRRTIKDRILSYATAEKKGQFHQLGHIEDHSNTKSDTLMTLDIKRVKALYQKQRWIERLTESMLHFLSAPVTHIHYDDLSNDTEAVIKDLHTFLCVNHEPPMSNFQKVTDGCWSKKIRNFDEINSIFKQ